jgi:hypothetical protein
MFLTVVAARVVYWIRFLKFAVVGIVDVLDGRGARLLSVYICCWVSPT